jgi:ribosomal protein S18 acetylase RimI-like enzyme
VNLGPSTELTRPELAELFTAAYEGYYLPFQVDEARLAHMVDAFDLDLDRSLVAWEDGKPVGLANLGVRGERTWLGGVGVIPSARRRGIGEQLTQALLDQAREAGAREMVLEVIVENEPAIALYEKLGFRTIRELDVLTLAAADGGEADEIDPAEAGRVIADARTEPEPWQREDATVDKLDGVVALAHQGAAALYRMEGERVNLLQAGGGQLDGLVGALRARGAIVALNYPAGGPVAAALRDAGATTVVRQLEMRVATRPCNPGRGLVSSAQQGG